MDTQRKTPNSDWAVDWLHATAPETVGTTQTVTVADYLAECAGRVKRKVPVLHPHTNEQHKAAKKAGYRLPTPARGEMHWEDFREPSPFPDRYFEKFLVTLRDDPHKRDQLRSVMREANYRG